MKCASLAILLTFAALPLLSEEPQKIPIRDLGTKFELTGKLHVPLGNLVKIEGTLVDGQSKGYEGGANLRVHRIDGQYTQEALQIVLKPYWNKWGDTEVDEGEALPKLEAGRTYEMEGYESGGYVGRPAAAYRRAGISLQTTGHYFRTEFSVIKAKAIQPIVFGPKMFPEKAALLGGIARTKDFSQLVVGGDWTVVVARGMPWPAELEGKAVETFGRYKPAPEGKTFDLVEGEWHLVKLEDQVGRKVALRGMARSMNGHWWFHYRGQDLYVDDMDKLPGWKVDNHWAPMVIEGRLERAKLPDLGQITLKEQPDLKDYFIVRGASWKPLPALLSPEVERPE